MPSTCYPTLEHSDAETSPSRMLIVKGSETDKKQKLPFSGIVKVKEVVIAGNYGVSNLGDEAMLDILCDLISDEMPGTKIVVPTRRPDILSDLHRHPDVKPVGAIKGAIRAFLSDILVIGGGTIFSSLSGVGVRAIILIAIMRKILLRKKFYFYGIGYSRSSSTFLSIISKLAFNLADAIHVRDSTSYSLIQEHIRHNRLFLIPELALSLKESKSLPREIAELLRRQDGPLIGFSLMYIPASKYNSVLLDSFKGFIEYLFSKHSARFFFLTFHPRTINYSQKWKSDSEIAKIIIDRLPERIRENCHVLNYYSPAETLKIVGALDVIISMRYHCLVFASMQHKPFIAISFDDKHSAFVKDFGGEILNIDKISPEHLIKKWQKMKPD
jgi:polysaccharide pyruvyl transferase WcaK-like protein